ncbi:MAG: hypothetical protein Q8N44_06100 [Rubrivivax sp.]|nr:hypothetical protein [Rubrivivax sp.]MDP3083247.1 hypothetical protein [Rubrivivax sp.]
MARMTPLASLRVPVGGQLIELQQIDFGDDAVPAAAAADATAAARTVVPMHLLRTRIREGSRFTVFDIDPLTAEQWGEALLHWARQQPRS